MKEYALCTYISTPRKTPRDTMWAIWCDWLESNAIEIAKKLLPEYIFVGVFGERFWKHPAISESFPKGRGRPVGWLTTLCHLILKRDI